MHGLDACFLGRRRLTPSLIRPSPTSRLLMSLRPKVDIRGGEFLESPDSSIRGVRLQFVDNERLGYDRAFLREASMKSGSVDQGIKQVEVGIRR